MRIALFPDDYLPKSTLVHAKMFHELALELQRCGHDPVIITPSHGKQAKRLQVDFFNGIEVWRFRNPPMRGQGKVKRVISESLLSLSAYLALRNVEELHSFDLCINYSPTIFFGPLMYWFKRKSKTFNYLVLRDMFPQWVIDEGMISANSPIAFYFRFFERLNYNVSDCIGLMSPANVRYFSSLNPKYKNIEVLRNWAEINPKCYSNKLIDVRAQLNLNDKVIFFYGGNIGHAQDMSNLLRLVKAMLPYSNAHFLFVGQGDEFELVKKNKDIENLVNLTLLHSINQDSYKEVLTQVDVGLFSLAKTHKAHNFPGKLLGYMLQSLPILGSVNIGNDVIDFLNGEGAGLAFVNGDDEALLNAAIYLLNDKSQRQKMGARGNEVLKAYFSVETAAQKIINAAMKGRA